MCGGPAPTPACKWILQRRHMVVFPDTHWTLWLPMCGTWRMLWVRWLWGHLRWDGTGPLWKHTSPKCSLCLLPHGTTVHQRLIHGMK